MSGNAARASSTARSDRQMVVLLIQRLRERVERLWGFAAGLRGPLRSTRSRAYRGGAAFGPQHDQLTRDDLGDVARLLLTIFPRPVLDPSFDIDLVALFQELFAIVAKPGPLVVQPVNPLHFGLFFLLPPFPVHLPAVCPPKVGTPGAVIR